MFRLDVGGGGGGGANGGPSVNSKFAHGLTRFAKTSNLYVCLQVPVRWPARCRKSVARRKTCASAGPLLEEGGGGRGTMANTAVFTLAEAAGLELRAVTERFQLDRYQVTGNHFQGALNTWRNFANQNNPENRDFTKHIKMDEKKCRRRGYERNRPVWQFRDKFRQRNKFPKRKRRKRPQRRKAVRKNDPFLQR